MEKLDLIGLDFLWQICLNTPDPTIAESGITLLMNVSYSNLTPRLKKVRSCINLQNPSLASDCILLALPRQGSTTVTLVNYSKQNTTCNTFYSS